MLVLTMQGGDYIVMRTKEGTIRIKLGQPDRGKCKVGIDAPSSIQIQRLDRELTPNVRRTGPGLRRV